MAPDAAATPPAGRAILCAEHVHDGPITVWLTIGNPFSGPSGNS
jgi:hypothetical protein